MPVRSFTRGGCAIDQRFRLVFGLLSPQRGGVRTAGIVVCSVGLVLTVASGVVGAILASRGMIP
jgi:hypothetical protein